MNDMSYLGPALTGLGILVTIVLFLVAALMQQGRKQGEKSDNKLQSVDEKLGRQETTLATVNATVTGVVDRVNDLHAWKNRQQEKENDRLEQALADVKARLRERDERAS